MGKVKDLRGIRELKSAPRTTTKKFRTYQGLGHRHVFKIILELIVGLAKMELPSTFEFHCQEKNLTRQ